MTYTNGSFDYSDFFFGYPLAWYIIYDADSITNRQEIVAILE